MFPLWDIAIAPVLAAAEARRVVEIGALRGENTVQILDALGPAGELHVIDPVPDFDPVEHAERFGGRYVFHQALSLDVLGDLPPMDAALIDGDHNWYTVYNECRLLAEVARSADAPLPVLVLHDVLWPYGRRDLYYDPTNIPDEYRQPHAQAGMRPGREDLLARGGLNPRMHNATMEGGPRNGVMTGLDDFMAEYDRPLRRLVLPIYFGLAIVVEEERLERQPELAAVFARLESAEGRYDLMVLAEETRLKAMVFQHNVHYGGEEKLARANARYLEVTKASLLNEHYLDHERRFALLHRKGAVDPVVLRDPARHDQQEFRRLQRHRSGPAGPSPMAERSFLPYTAMGRHRLDHLHRCLDEVQDGDIAGDLVDCGTGRGGAAIFMRAHLEANEDEQRSVWVLDRFRASPEPQTSPTLPANGVDGFQADLNLVRDGFDRFGLLDGRVRFLRGAASEALVDDPIAAIALLRIGYWAGGEVRPILDALYDRVSPGGTVIVEVGRDVSARLAVEAFRTSRNISGPLEWVDENTVSWTRTADDRVAAPAEVTGRPEVAAAAGERTTCALSVVVVFYNMRREAARTLRSLSRAYQEGIDDVDYEVVVVENGSDLDQRLGEEYVAAFGPEFRHVDMGTDAQPSPVAALNRGIAIARGDALALMIDGAHVLTPGVLRYGLAGLATYAPAIVCTQQWYVGPGQQGEAIDNGYDEAYEDRLFDVIGWPTAGYRLFEIGHFIGGRDWLDGLWESNCIFVSRAQLEQVGAFDPAFSMPGGGYANLELYERLGASPDVSVVTILGEGSFHQTHGGTTTNQPDPAERRARVFGYGEHYAQLHGRAHKGPGKPIHYVGHFHTPDARRSKPRRMSARRFADGAAVMGDGPPTVPVPVPDELREGFVEAVWNNMPWTRTRWMGRPIAMPPTDLFALQEIIVESRPDWIIETGTGNGGRALFLASVCELVGNGAVISIDTDQPDDLPKHPRLRYLPGSGDEPDTVATVGGLVGSGGALVVIGSRRHRRHLVAEFEAYQRLVPPGSYVVITDTVVNGNPVWTAFGPGPAEAVKVILREHGDFVQDTSLERYSLTFGPGGFLRRVE